MANKQINTSHLNYSPLLAIFDLDGTLTKRDTYIPFLLFILKHRPIRIFYVSILPFFIVFFYFKIIDNNKLKQLFLSAFLKRAKVEKVLVLASQFVDQLLKTGMSSIGLQLLRYHQDQGDNVLMATASFDIYVRILAKHLNVDEVVCTEAEVVGGRFTGKINRLNCHGNEKLRRIKQYLGNIDKKMTIAYSDDIIDFPMLQWAAKGCLVTPSRKCLKDPKSKGFKIIKKC